MGDPVLLAVGVFHVFLEHIMLKVDFLSKNLILTKIHRLIFLNFCSKILLVFLNFLPFKKCMKSLNFHAKNLDFDDFDGKNHKQNIDKKPILTNLGAKIQICETYSG